MSGLKHVLVPTDFGEPADRALDLAIEIASKFDAKITLLHASWLPPSAYTVYAEGVYWPTDEMAKEAQKELVATLTTAKKRYPNISSLLVTGESWVSILAVAKEHDADMIVMGTHGRRGLSHLLLGSVAEKVVRLSPIPVLTVSGKAEQARKEQALGGDSTEKVAAA